MCYVSTIINICTDTDYIIMDTITITLIISAAFSKALFTLTKGLNNPVFVILTSTGELYYVLL